MALALLLMELVVRQVYQVPLTFEPGFGSIIQPGITVRWWREGHGKSHWTRLGLRGRETPDLSKDSVLVLGNSFTEALQVDDDQAFTSLVQQRLLEAGIRRNVLNVGRSGSSAPDYVAFAEREKRRFHPCWTVIQLNPDDLGSRGWRAESSRFAYADDGRLLAQPLPDVPRGRLRSTLSPLVNSSMLLVYGRYRFQEFMAAHHEEPPLFRAGTVVVPPKDARPTTYPVEAELNLLAGAYDRRLTFLFIAALDFRAPSAVTDPIETRFLAHCAEAALSCVTLRPGYAGLVSTGRSPFGFANTRFNEGHLNTAGHLLAADALAIELKRLAARGLL